MTTGRALLCLLALAAVTPARAEPTHEGRARTHWAYRPVRRPAAPAHDARNPVDAFLLEKLAAAGLRPAPAAARHVLLRRAFLDLVGVPPSPAEQDAFLDDASPDAYERLIDRLLADPRHGERWARHWLDVVRYADTNGYERDGDKPFAWRYRDWVVAALNADVPYDRFVREQIAGDELPDADANTHVATTFLRLGTWDDEPADDAVDRFDQLDDVLGVTTSAFLAQTVRCARCHDHKFEAISQRDYYRMLAVFTPLRRPQLGRSDLSRPVGTRAQLDAHERSRRASLELAGRIDEVSARVRERVFIDGTSWPADVRLAFSTPAERRTASQNLTVSRNKSRYDRAAAAVVSDKERERLAALQRQWAEAERRRPPEPAKGYVWYEDGPAAPPTRLLRRGNPSLVGPAVEPGVPDVMGRPAGAPRPSERSTGRRLWLADWVASKDNPLTARVIANRLWQWHFGTGLVRTPGDFGLAGDAPSHPELLDFLASYLVERGWSLKALHRLIVTSDAYRATSAADGPDAARKPGLFGRWRLRRLEAEAVRDSMLSVSGRLVREQFGPGVYPPLPAAVLATQSRPGLGWGKSSPEQASRRSVYVFSKRSLVPPELELLDAPDTNAPCEARGTSTTAPQALTFLNGEFANEQAGHFADRLLAEASDDEGRVRLAYRLALGRPPGAQEQRRVLAFLAAQARRVAAEGAGEAEARRRALASFCLVVFNLSEFVYSG